MNINPTDITLLIYNEVSLIINYYLNLILLIFE